MLVPTKGEHPKHSNFEFLLEQLCIQELMRSHNLEPVTSVDSEQTCDQIKSSVYKYLERYADTFSCY